MRVALGRDDFQIHVAPGEGFVVLKVGVNRHVLRQGKEGVAIVVVDVDALVLPEKLGLLEEMPFVLGHGDLGAMFPEAPGAPTLIAVVMRMEHPLDLPHADFFEVVDDGARPGVDEDAAVTRGNAVDIAGVGPAKDSWGNRDPSHERLVMRGPGAA